MLCRHTRGEQRVAVAVATTNADRYGLRGRVRLTAEPDHVGVWPDGSATGDGNRRDRQTGAVGGGRDPARRGCATMRPAEPGRNAINHPPRARD